MWVGLHDGHWFHPYGGGGGGGGKSKISERLLSLGGGVGGVVERMF